MKPIATYHKVSCKIQNLNQMKNLKHFWQNRHAIIGLIIVISSFLTVLILLDYLIEYLFS